MSMELHESGENYLKAILILQERYGYVRSVDVAEWLGVSKPSVSNAVRSLSAGGYLSIERKKKIRLTESGRKAAEKVYERHCFLTKGLIAVGVDPKVAEKDACKIEHDLSEESYERLKAYLESYISSVFRNTGLSEGIE